MLTFEHEMFEASLTDGQVKIGLIFVEKIRHPCYMFFIQRCNI
jgi:hypothetical protein